MSASRHEHPELGQPELVEVAEGVFAYVQPDGSWFINNTGFVVGREQLIAVDACSTERRTRAFRERMAQVSPAPVGVLVNTHHHGDHTYGNAAVGAAVVVGHESCRTEVLAAGPPRDTGFWDPVDWGELPVTPPTITFTDRLRLWSDDRPVELLHVGQPAHTTNDVLVWLPEQEVLFCGDLLFNGGTPFLLMGSVAGAVEVLTTVLAGIPARTVVPGHGAPCGPELVEPTVGYLRFVLDTARAARAAGLTPLEAARETDLGGYAGWLDPERIVGNLHRAYADLDGRRDVDVVAALSDMVAYNGGRPLSCWA